MSAAAPACGARGQQGCSELGRVDAGPFDFAQDRLVIVHAKLGQPGLRCARRPATPGWPWALAILEPAPVPRTRRAIVVIAVDVEPVARAIGGRDDRTLMIGVQETRPRAGERATFVPQHRLVNTLAPGMAARDIAQSHRRMSAQCQQFINRQEFHSKRKRMNAAIPGKMVRVRRRWRKCWPKGKINLLRSELVWLMTLTAGQRTRPRRDKMGPNNLGVAECAYC